MTATLNAPIIVDLGKASRKRVRQLKRGRGKLVADVQDALTEVTTSLGEEANGKQLIPVVLLYRRRGRRGRGGLIPALF